MLFTEHLLFTLQAEKHSFYVTKLGLAVRLQTQRHVWVLPCADLLRRMRGMVFKETLLLFWKITDWFIVNQF